MGNHFLHKKKYQCYPYTNKGESSMKSIQIIMILVCIGIPCLEMQSQENAAVIYWRAFHEAQHIPKNFTKNAIAYINGEKNMNKNAFKLSKSIKVQFTK